jgi:hypothetical protein
LPQESYDSVQEYGYWPGPFGASGGFMGYANYQNLSELMNEMLAARPGVSISEMVEEAEGRMMGIEAAEGLFAGRSSLENGFIALVGQLAQTAKIAPQPANETESRILQLYQSGKLAEDGFEGREGNLFLDIKWIPITGNLPLIKDLGF